MKKLFFALTCLSLFPSLALASQEETSRPWTCRFEGDLKGYRADLILSISSLQGGVDLECESIHGETLSKRVYVSLSKSKIALQVNRPQSQNARIRSTSIYLKHPRQLLGFYDLSFLNSLSIQFNFEVTPKNASMNEVTDFGLDLDLDADESEEISQNFDRLYIYALKDAQS